MSELESTLLQVQCSLSFEALVRLRGVRPRPPDLVWQTVQKQSLETGLQVEFWGLISHNWY